MENKLQTARLLIAAAEKHAAELGINITTAVVDDGGNLIAFARTDGSQLASTALCQGKAYSAVAWKRPSRNMYDITQPGGPGWALQQIDSRFVFSGGGMPILEDGVIVGAIGVSGGSADQDQECAEAALATLE